MYRARLRMRLELKRQEYTTSLTYRKVGKEDAAALGRLMLEAYRGTVDYEGETLEEAISEVREMMRGKYGPFFEDASFMIEGDGRALSASLVTLWGEANSPLLAYSMTHPDVKGTGMATLLVKLTVNALLALGYQELSLVVSEANQPARRLYGKLGFLPVQRTVRGRELRRGGEATFKNRSDEEAHL